MAGRLRTVALASTVALAAVACADEEPAFDPAIIPAAVQVEVDPIGITAVGCDGAGPVSPTLPETGGRFECTGTLNGDPVVLAVTVAPEIDGNIAVAADVLTPLFDVAAAETAAAARLDAELGGAPEIDCPERLVVIEPGRRIDCRVTAEGGTAGPVDQALAIVILDTDADWEIDLAP